MQSGKRDLRRAGTLVAVLAALALGSGALAPAAAGGYDHGGRHGAHHPGKGHAFGHHRGKGHAVGHHRGRGHAFRHHRGKGHAFGHRRGKGHAFGHRRGKGHRGHRHGVVHYRATYGYGHLLGQVLGLGHHLRPPAYAFRHGYRHHYRPRLRPCHRVTRVEFTRHGRKVKVGGTMCYDRHGSPYIVAGSRHVIHFY